MAVDGGTGRLSATGTADAQLRILQDFDWEAQPTLNRAEVELSR